MRDIIRRNRTDPIIGKPRPEDSERPKRSRKVKLWTIMYDEDRCEFIRTERRMDREDLPPDAVEVTKLKDTWLLDSVGAPEPDIEGNPAGITAASLNLWMVNNSINEALSGKWNARMDMEQLKKLAVIGFVAIVICFSVYAII